MSAETVSGHLAEMGWGDADDSGGRLRSATGSVLLLGVAGAYCASVWFSSGFAPLAYVASHMQRVRKVSGTR